MAVITLLTDFQLHDPYAAILHGVILGINPAATIVDLTHLVSPQDVDAAALLLQQAYAYFPRGTIHVVVVDPGVGTSRRPILLEAAGQYFIAPDNGVLSMVYAAEEKRKVRAITAERYFRQPVSSTFHGRDIFAPAAAHLAAGVTPARLGKRIDDYLRREDFDRPLRTGKRMWAGAVLHIDRFGNVVTNFRPSDIPGLPEGRAFEMVLGPHRIADLVRTYAEGGTDAPFVIVGSSGYLEISVNQASAARRLGCAVGAPIEIVVY